MYELVCTSLRLQDEQSGRGQAVPSHLTTCQYTASSSTSSSRSTSKSREHNRAQQSAAGTNKKILRIMLKFTVSRRGIRQKVNSSTQLSSSRTKQMYKICLKSPPNKYRPGRAETSGKKEVYSSRSSSICLLYTSPSPRD